MLKLVPVYDTDNQLLGRYTQEDVKRLMVNHRYRSVISRHGELCRLYLLDEVEPRLGLGSYTGGAYSHRRATKTNPKNVWTLKRISDDLRPNFRAVLDSVVKEEA